MAVLPVTEGGIFSCRSDVWHRGSVLLIRDVAEFKWFGVAGLQFSQGGGITCITGWLFYVWYCVGGLKLT